MTTQELSIAIVGCGAIADFVVEEASSIEGVTLTALICRDASRPKAEKLVADPSVRKNIHEIDAEGAFGRLSVHVEGNPLPGNPKSSALAAMSIVAELKRRINRVGI